MLAGGYAKGRMRDRTLQYEAQKILAEERGIEIEKLARLNVKSQEALDLLLKRLSGEEVYFEGPQEIEQAIETLRPKIRDAAPGSAERNKFCNLVYLLALALHRAGDLDRAGRVLGELFALTPDHALGLKLKGVLEFQQNEYALAERSFKRWLALGGEDERADIEYLLAQSLVAQERDTEALHPLNRALEKNPDFVPALRERARIRAKIGDWELAKIDQARIVKIVKSPEDFVRLGMIVLETGDVDNAEKVLMGVPASPRAELLALFARAQNNLSWKLLGAGKKKRALAAARMAWAILPDEAVTNDTLGWMLFQNGELDAAREHALRAEILMPHEPSIREHLRTIENALREKKKGG